MQRHLSLFLSLLLASAISANPLSRQQAARRASTALQLGLSRSTALEQLFLTAAEATTDQPFYVFQTSDSEAFVIASADSELSDVLAYGSLPAGRQPAVPCGLKEYLAAYSTFVGQYRRGEVQLAADEVAPDETSPLRAKRRASHPAAVEPLLTTLWGQDAPYNTLCPDVEGQKCPSGCVATALAQILNYWQWPAQGSGYSWAKVNDGTTYSGSLEHTYAWHLMLPHANDFAQSEEASAAVAELLYDCGLAMHMNYDPAGSGAGIPTNAFCTNFNYRPSTMRRHIRECYTADEWWELIVSEIAQGRPVYHTATSSVNAGRDASGHAFIIDGYDTNQRFHVNWGWDGDFNGYYSPSLLNPNHYQFSLSQSVITGLMPNRQGEEGMPLEYPYMFSSPTCSNTGRISKSLAFDIVLGSIFNLNANAHAWQLTVGLFDTQGTMVADVHSGRTTTLQLDPSYYVNEGFNKITCKLNGSYPDGHYALRVVFREGNSGDWLLPDVNGGQSKNAIYVQLSGAKVTFTDGKDYIALGLPSVPAATPVATAASTRAYNLSGQAVQPLRRGLYVVGGRKVVVR